MKNKRPLAEPPVLKQPSRIEKLTSGTLIIVQDAPPVLDDSSEWSQSGDPRYAELGEDAPRTECLKDVVTRLLPYWESDITKDLETPTPIISSSVQNVPSTSTQSASRITRSTFSPASFRRSASLHPRRDSSAKRRG